MKFCFKLLNETKPCSALRLTENLPCKSSPFSFPLAPVSNSANLKRLTRCSCCEGLSRPLGNSICRGLGLELRRQSFQKKSFAYSRTLNSVFENVQVRSLLFIENYTNRTTFRASLQVIHGVLAIVLVLVGTTLVTSG